MAQWEDIELLGAAVGCSVSEASKSIYMNSRRWVCESSGASALGAVCADVKQQMGAGEVRNALRSQTGAGRPTCCICHHVTNSCCSTCRMRHSCSIFNTMVPPWRCRAVMSSRKRDAGLWCGGVPAAVLP